MQFLRGKYHGYIFCFGCQAVRLNWTNEHVLLVAGSMSFTVLGVLLCFIFSCDFLIYFFCRTAVELWDIAKRRSGKCVVFSHCCYCYY